MANYLGYASEYNRMGNPIAEGLNQIGETVQQGRLQSLRQAMIDREMGMREAAAARDAEQSGIQNRISLAGLNNMEAQQQGQMAAAGVKTLPDLYQRQAESQAQAAQREEVAKRIDAMTKSYMELSKAVQAGEISPETSASVFRWSMREKGINLPPDMEIGFDETGGYYSGTIKPEAYVDAGNGNIVTYGELGGTAGRVKGVRVVGLAEDGKPIFQMPKDSNFETDKAESTWGPLEFTNVGGVKQQGQWETTATGQKIWHPKGQDKSTTVVVGGGHGGSKMNDNPKSKPISPGVEKRLTSSAELADSMDRFSSGFQPSYAGHTIMGDLSNTAGRIVGDDSGQAQWWQDYQGYVNDVRQEKFGASLTTNEKNEFLKYIVTPRMKAEQVQENLTRQKAITDTALARVARGYATQYDPQTVEEFIGRPIPAATAAQAPKIQYGKNQKGAKPASKTQSVKSGRFTIEEVP